MATGPHVTFALRDYQLASVDAALDAVGPAVITLPTGAGKSAVGAEVVRRWLSLDPSNHVLWVAHLRELIDQAIDNLERAVVTNIGVLRGADPRKRLSARCQVASIQTLARRPHRESRGLLVVLDECHRSLARMYESHVWQPYVDHPALAGDPPAKVVGLTATPVRTDGKALKRRYESLHVGATYSGLIERGHISEPLVYAPKVPPNLSGIKTVAGDYDQGELADSMRTIAGDVVEMWLEHAGSLPTILFSVDVAHSRDLVQRFVDAGIAAGHLDGETPEGERRDLIAQLRDGRLRLLSNCAVLTEGFDAPNVRCVILARPTKSLVLHMQTAGRCLRPGPVQPVILDHAGNVSRHGMPHQDRPWDIDQDLPKQDAEANPYRTCPACFAYTLASSRVCSLCGHEVVPKPRPAVEETRGEFVRVTASDEQQNFKRALAVQARDWGYKPGWVKWKYEERHGRASFPWADFHALKAWLMKNEGWVRRNGEREASKRERDRIAEAVSFPGGEGDPSSPPDAA